MRIMSDKITTGSRKEMMLRNGAGIHHSAIRCPELGIGVSASVKYQGLVQKDKY
jgi:hypothetical protein